MTNEELDRLEALAQSVIDDTDASKWWTVSSLAPLLTAEAKESTAEIDAAFVAAASPDVVLRLVAELRAARESDAESCGMYRSARDSRDRLAAELAKVTSALPSTACDRCGSVCATCEVEAPGFAPGNATCCSCIAIAYEEHECESIRAVLREVDDALLSAGISRQDMRTFDEQIVSIAEERDAERSAHAKALAEIERLRAMVPSEDYACFCCRDVLVPEVPLCERCIHGCDEDEFHLGKIAVDRERCRLEREQDQRLARIESAKENGR